MIKDFEGMVYRGRKVGDIYKCRCGKDIKWGHDEIDYEEGVCTECYRKDRWECGFCNWYGRGYHNCNYK